VAGRKPLSSTFCGNAVNKEHETMTKYVKLLAKVLSGRSDSNIDFDNLRRLLTHFEFVERVRASHHVFVRPGVEDLVNFQREGRLAKRYQVRQVRAVITTYGLAAEEDD
jgi:hemerythrin-like domain-containing protein